MGNDGSDVLKVLKHFLSLLSFLLIFRFLLLFEMKSIFIFRMKIEPLLKLYHSTILFPSPAVPSKHLINFFIAEAKKKKLLVHSRSIHSHVACNSFWYKIKMSRRSRREKKTLNAITSESLHFYFPYFFQTLIPQSAHTHTQRNFFFLFKKFS